MADESEFDLEAFKEDLELTLEKSRAAFKGKYKAELNALAGLSREEVDAITPDATDLEIYDQLMTVVKEASRVNLTEVEFKAQVHRLGHIAFQIARKVPSLAALLA